MWVCSLSQEDPLKKEMAMHSSSLPWKIPWTNEPGRLIMHIQVKIPCCIPEINIALYMN